MAVEHVPVLRLALGRHEILRVVPHLPEVRGEARILADLGVAGARDKRDRRALARAAARTVVRDEHLAEPLHVAPAARNEKLEAALAIIDKRRDKPNVAQVMHIIGEVKGHDCLLLDDMVDTAGTLTEGASALKANGAGRIFAACSHAVLSGPAIKRINESVLEEVIATNTISLDSKQQECRKLTVLSVAPLLAEAITRIHEETSLSSLFV